MNAKQKEWYLKSMAVGAKVKENKTIWELSDEWNAMGTCKMYAEIIVHAIDYKNNESTIDEMMIRIANAMNKYEGYNIFARGFLAGEILGAPNEKNIELASKSEVLWNSDNGSKYGYYQEVLNEVKNG